MNINKILFDSLQTKGIDFSFNDLDVNNDGQISAKDADLTANTDIKKAIKSVLNSVDEENSIIQKDSVSKESTSSARQTSNRTGLPVTDQFTFKNDVINSKGTVYVYIGNQYRDSSSSFGACEKKAAENLSEIQKYANVYHLDTINTDLVNKLCQEAGISTSFNVNKILKFVDGKFVEVISQNDALKVENLINKAEGTPSAMPDVATNESKNTETKRNEYGVKTTNTQDFEKDVLNSKGTVYVTIGNLSTCAKCQELQNALKQNAQTLSNVADVYALSTDTDRELCWQIYRDMGGADGTKAMPLPQVAKFVDGKFVQLMPAVGLSEDTVGAMIKLAKGTAIKDKDGIAQTSAARFDEDVKKSKGTTYVMITSADGCQYCNYLHNQLKTMLSEVEGSFGFYELATNQGADRELCWQIYRDLGGGDGTKAMPLPQIAKFVDGEFVELITNTRDFGTAGMNNATIKEMFEKVQGTPVNTINSKSSTADSDTETKESQGKEITTKEGSSQSELQAMMLVQNQLNSIKLIKEIKEEEYEKLQKELEAKQEEIEDLSEKIKSCKDETLLSSYQSELSTLQNSVESIQSSMNSLETEINTYNSRYMTYSRSLQLMNKTSEK